MKEGTSEVPTDRRLSTFRSLEKQKAGIGAAGLVALLWEGLFSPGVAARALGPGLPVAERLGGLSVIGLSIIAFFIVYLWSDISDDEIKREISPPRFNSE